VFEEGVAAEDISNPFLVRVNMIITNYCDPITNVRLEMTKNSRNV